MDANLEVKDILSSIQTSHICSHRNLLRHRQDRTSSQRLTHQLKSDCSTLATIMESQLQAMNCGLMLVMTQQVTLDKLLVILPLQVYTRLQLLQMDLDHQVRSTDLSLEQ